MDITGIGEIAQVADDVVKEISTITNLLLAEREPLRQFRIMNKLIDKVKAVCAQYVTVPVKTFVAALCGTLPADKQADIVTIVTDELAEAQSKQTTVPCAVVENVSIVNQNKSTKMSTETGTALETSELALATAAGKAVQTIGLFIKKGDAFVQAAIAGVASIQPTQVVTIKTIIDQAFTVLGTIAIVTGLKAFIQLSLIAKYFYDDCANGSENVIQIIRALMQSKPAIKAALAEASAKQADPNFTSDELSIATGLGALVAMLAIYLNSKTVGKSVAFTDAFMEGVAAEPANATPVVKDVVDDSFSIISCIATILNYQPLTVAIETVQALYDDFAGAKTGLLGLYEEMTKAKAKLAVAA
jgi:hypothetical protein